MRACIGDIALFVEVVGKKLALDQGLVSERPTVVFLHGGPGWDHLTLLPDFAPLADTAQLIFYDHRGLGRSDISDPRFWTLKQWADDLKNLISVLGLGRPIILGQSFGGMVAQQFAIDYPECYSGLILSATAARFRVEAVIDKFRTIGSVDYSDLARKFFTSVGSPEEHDRFISECIPLYTLSRQKIGSLAPYTPHVMTHFWSDAGDGRRFDFRHELAQIVAPTLIIGGDSDPVIQPDAVLEMSNAFSRGVASTIIFENCGHGPARDRPNDALPLLRNFITSVG